MAERDLARAWLTRNGYKDIETMIGEIIAEWKADGKGTRRNWWEILAGDQNGNPRKVAGREFPVLKAAQIRQRIPVTPNAISRSSEVEPAPSPWTTERWPKRRKHHRPDAERKAVNW